MTAFMIAVSGTVFVPKVSTLTDTGFRHAYRVRQLHFAAACELRTHDVLATHLAA